MSLWSIVAVVVAGAVLYALRRFVYETIAESGAERERARQAERDLQTARDTAKDAAQAAETRHEIDRSNFDDAVDRL